MPSPKLVVLIALVAYLILLISPSQSMPADDHTSEVAASRQKRWTFNTWRLHGRRQLPKGFYTPTSSIAVTADGHPYRIFDEDNDFIRRIHERIAQAFPQFTRK